MRREGAKPPETRCDSMFKFNRNRRLVMVSEEHCGDLTEKYFTTLDRVEDQYGHHYDTGDGYDTLTDMVKDRGDGWLNTSYRQVYVKAVTPDNVKGVVKNNVGDIGYDIDSGRYLMAAEGEEPDDYYSEELLEEFKSVTDEELEYLGATKAQIKAARKAAANGEYGPLFDLWKETWDPRSTPEELYPQLEALGVPKRCYDPSVNKYRGSGRGSFNLKRSKQEKAASRLVDNTARALASFWETYDPQGFRMTFGDGKGAVSVLSAQLSNRDRRYEWLEIVDGVAEQEARKGNPRARSDAKPIVDAIQTLNGVM